MFGRSKPVVFERYGRRRSRRVPRWLLLLVTGIALGAAGVVLVQEQYLPPRLSAAETTQLRQSHERIEGERQRLARELADTIKRLEAAQADKQKLGDELAAGRETVARLRGDVASLVEALPPDPRGGAVEVRAARFSVDGPALAYDVVLTRERRGGKPLSGVMQIVVAGDAGRGPEATATLKPVAVSVGDYESVRGSLPLPDGFRPKLATIHVLDRVDGKRLGMRVIHVK
jgi:hypothetical protein